MEENKNLNEETAVENEVEETAVEAEVVPEAETTAEATEDAEIEVEVEEVAESPEEETDEEAVSEDEEAPAEEAPAEAKSNKKLIKIAAGIVCVAIIVALTVFLTPRVKYLYAKILISSNKIDKAYEVLTEIDGGYKRAEQELKRFIIVPEKVTSKESGGMGNNESEITRKVETGKNYAKETIKAGEQTQITETTYDAKGNIVKEVISQPGAGKYICTYKYDKDGNRTHYLVKSEDTKVYEVKEKYDKDGNCTYSSTFEMSFMGETTSEKKSDNYRIYYVKKK